MGQGKHLLKGSKFICNGERSDVELLAPLTWSVGIVYVNTLQYPRLLGYNVSYRLHNK